MRFDLNTGIIILCFSIALFTLIGLAIAASPQLERAVLASDGVREASPLELHEALERHEDVRAFILRSEELEAATPEERAHLADVRRLTEILIGVSLLLMGIGVGAMRRTTLGYRAIARRVSVSIIGIVVVLASLAGIIGFEALFWNFHFVFFPQGNFAFPTDSYLITLYPYVFFAYMAAWTGALLIAIMGVVYTLSRERR